MTGNLALLQNNHFYLHSNASYGSVLNVTYQKQKVKLECAGQFVIDQLFKEDKARGEYLLSVLKLKGIPDLKFEIQFSHPQGDGTQQNRIVANLHGDGDISRLLSDSKLESSEGFQVG
jgi:hypothetical protein